MLPSSLCDRCNSRSRPSTSGRPRTLRELQQRFGDPPFEMTETEVFDLLARVAQTLAQNLDQHQADVGVIFEERHEIAAVQHQQLAIAHRHRIAAALATVERPNFAHDLAGVDDV